MTRHRSHAWLTLALNFVREHTPESCTRLCAVWCCITGCLCASATVVFAFTNPAAAATVAALVGVSTALIGGGTVALLVRNRKPDPDSEPCALPVPMAIGGAQ